MRRFFIHFLLRGVCEIIRRRNILMNENLFAFFAPPISTPPGHSTSRCWLRRRRQQRAMKREGDLNLKLILRFTFSFPQQMIYLPPIWQTNLLRHLFSPSVLNACACVCSFISFHFSTPHPHSFRIHSRDIVIKKEIPTERGTIVPHFISHFRWQIICDCVFMYVLQISYDCHLNTFP